MQEFERDLAYAFRHRAEEVPATAVERVTAVDYRPRVGRMTPRLTAGAIAGAAATTATVATVVSVVGAPAAFAGWKATPTTGAGTTTSAARATCGSHLAQLAQNGPTSTTAPTWSPVATDVRGPYTLVVYDGSTGQAQATCLTSTTFTSVWESGTPTHPEISSSVLGVQDVQAGNRSSSDLSTLGIGALGSGSGPVIEVHADVSGQGSYTLVEGQVPETVTAVTLELSDGDVVQATTGDGSFVAWWPGSADATSAELTSATGTTTEPLSRLSGPGGACSTRTASAPGRGCSPGSATTQGGTGGS